MRPNHVQMAQYVQVPYFSYMSVLVDTQENITYEGKYILQVIVCIYTTGNASQKFTPKKAFEMPKLWSPTKTNNLLKENTIWLFILQKQV